MLKTKTVTRRVVDMPALYRQIGARMRLHREKRGMTQQDVGLVLNMTRANVANLERGGTRILLEHVYNAALLFRVPAARLLP